MFPLTRQQHIFLQLALIPTAALVASHVVFSQVFPGQLGYQFPWSYFLTVVTVMFSCWEVNVFIFRWLDTHLSFGQNPVRRLLVQVLLGGIATLVTFALVFPLAQRIYTNQWPPLTTFFKGITVCITLATIVNGSYSGLYLLQAFLEERKKSTEQLNPSFAQASITSTVLPVVTVEVSTGQLRLPFDQIAYFYSAGGLVLLIKADGQQITTRYSSFSRLMEGLDNRYFFQLSRQFIVSLGAIQAVQDDVNRKLIVTLAPALHKKQVQQEVVVSRYRSLELKKWLQASSAH